MVTFSQYLKLLIGMNAPMQPCYNLADDSRYISSVALEGTPPALVVRPSIATAMRCAAMTTAMLIVLESVLS
eukprot:4659258-Amphidinium_carterae.4